MYAFNNNNINNNKTTNAAFIGYAYIYGVTGPLVQALEKAILDTFKAFGVKVWPGAQLVPDLDFVEFSSRHPTLLGGVEPTEAVRLNQQAHIYELHQASASDEVYDVLDKLLEEQVAV
jgi:hypothetical protein